MQPRSDDTEQEHVATGSRDKPIASWRRALLLTLIVILTPIYSIFYTDIHVFPAAETPLGYGEQAVLPDALVYLDMYDGKPAPAPYRYRVLTVYLARLLPALPPSMFSELRKVTPEWQKQIHFGIVNLVFLCAAGVALFYYLVELTFTFIESLLGVVLFLGCKPVVQTAGLPLVDASAYFFLVLGFLAIARRDAGLLAVTLLVGAFAKETVFLLAVPVVLASCAWRERVRMTVAFVPAAVIYGTFRILLAYAYRRPGLGLEFTWEPLELIESLFRFNRFVDLASSFSSLWILAFVGLGSSGTPAEPKRAIWFAAVIFALILVSGSNLGRIMVLAFPVIIPLTLFGLRSLAMRLGIDYPGVVQVFSAPETS
jgi:hypothetical protein